MGIERRTFLGGVGGTIFGSTAKQYCTDTALAKTEQQENQSFPMFQYNAANTGYNQNSGGPKASVRQKWSFETEGQIRSSPVVANGTVYFGSTDGRTYAVNENSGERVWTVETGEVRTAPALSGQHLYVTSPSRASNATTQTTSDDSEGRLYALFASNGGEIWNFGLGRSVTAPSVVGNTVYVGGDRIYALEKNSGVVRWSHTRSDTGIDERTAQTPAVSRERVLVSFLDSDSYRGNQNRTTAYSRDGSQQWQIGQVFNATPTVANGKVYGEYDNVTRAVNAGNGNQIWGFRTGQATSIAIANGTVFLGSTENRVYALNANNGNLRWLFPTNSPVQSAPVVASGTVYFGTDSGTVYAVNANDGGQRWEFETGAAVRSSPAVVNGSLYVGTDNGQLYALAPE